MAKKDIYITPKDSVTREIINLSQVSVIYINAIPNRHKLTLHVGDTKDYLEFPSIEKCELFFNKVKELLGSIDI